MLSLILAASDSQTIIGAAGAVITAGGGVAWVIRVEKDLLGAYRSRMLELENELTKANKQKEAWRERFWVLARKAMDQRSPLQWDAIDAMVADEPDSAPVAIPPPTADLPPAP